MEAFYMLFEQV